MLKRRKFCETIHNAKDDAEILLRKIFCSNEATLYFSRKVNRHNNVRIWRTKHPQVTLEVERDSPKVDEYCAMSEFRVFGPFLEEETNHK